jgi:signal transduction histidine kinase
MINTGISRKKLFGLFSALGILNIILAYVFFYFSSITLLEQRSTSQMASVRALASQKLRLYVDNLKYSSLQNANQLLIAGVTSDPFLKESLTGIYFQGSEGPYSVLRGSAMASSHFDKLKEQLTFYPLGVDGFMLKVTQMKGSMVLTFNFNGINEMLKEHEGMGKSGEIYLVGHDNIIRSASRHLQNGAPIKVDNASIELAKKQASGVHTVRDYRNVEVLSAYSPFDLDHLQFILISEIDKAEVLSSLKALFPKVFILCLFFCLLALFLAYILSAKILELVEDMKLKMNEMHIKFITTMEEENQKISLNLHDGVGQILTAIKWGVTQKTDPEKLKSLFDDAFKEIRSVSDDLMPVELSSLGFFAAVRNYFRKQQSYYDIKIDFWYNERLGNFKFKEGFDTNLYRLVQELLQNTLKHARATSVSIVMFKEGDDLLVRYEDDGVGMPEAAPLPKMLHYRCDLMGASLKRIHPEKGLVFQIAIPLKRIFE